MKSTDIELCHFFSISFILILKNARPNILISELFFYEQNSRAGFCKTGWRWIVVLPAYTTTKLPWPTEGDSCSSLSLSHSVCPHPSQNASLMCTWMLIYMYHLTCVVYDIIYWLNLDLNRPRFPIFYFYFLWFFDTIFVL